MDFVNDPKNDFQLMKVVDRKSDCLTEVKTFDCYDVFMNPVRYSLSHSLTAKYVCLRRVDQWTIKDFHLVGKFDNYTLLHFVNLIQNHKLKDYNLIKR